MSGLATSGGAAPHGHSTSVVSGISISGLTFQFTATTAAQYLAATWQAAHAYTTGQVVVHQGRVYRCTTSGTSAASGPLTTGSVTDGTAIWRGVGSFDNGFEITNTSTTIVIYWSIGEATSATIGKAIMPGGGVRMTVADPSLISVIATSSTVVLAMGGLS